MSFEREEESMNYKSMIRKATHGSVDGCTKEYVIFNVISTSKKLKVSFLFDWLYDEDGFSYKKLYQFSGHKRYREEDQKWLENYCKENYPDAHHMSY